MKRVVLAAVAGLWLVAARQSLADDVAPADGQTPAAAAGALRFRRVYAPAGEIKDWPLGNVPYLPMESREFERLIEAVHHDDQGAPRATGAQLKRADYHARLRSPDVLEGEAVLTIGHRTTVPVLLALEPLGLAISEAVWKADEFHSAVLGRSPDGRVGVMVDRSGDLKLVWSLRGERGAAGEMTFALDLPVCAAGHLTLDLPAGLVPSVDRGLIRQGERSENATRRWSIDLDGSHRLLLRLASADAASPRKPLALVRQTTVYEFSPRGVDVSVQLRLDVHDAPLERLAVQIDPRLQLVAAHYADRDVPWTIGPGPGGAGTQAILELPEPISGTGRIVRLSALSALEEGQKWRLPSVRAEGTTWLEGTCQLVVPKPLVVEQLITAGCRQSKAAPLGAPLAGESLEFQCFSADAAIDVVVGRPRDMLHVDAASAVELSPVEITCRAVAELSLRQGEEFDLGAQIGPQWLIDSVEAGGTETIEDWQVEAQDGRQQRLAVHLKQGVSAARPVRLTIIGHRPAQATQTFGLADLEMLHFAGAQHGKRWMALRASDAHELQLGGADELARLDPQQFTPAESQLFVEPPSGPVFAITPAAERLQVGTAARKPLYNGEISIDVMVDARNLTETFTFRCLPQASRLDRVLAFFSHARDVPLRFSLAGGSSGQISARRLPTENYAALGAAPGGEVWEIMLRLPRTGPFEIRGVRTVPLTGKRPLSLASLPEAATARGILAVRALGETSVTIDNQRLKPIPAELLQAEFYQTARGTYRYEPSRDVASSETAISVSVTGPNASESGAWVWQARLDSRYARQDGTVHTASWRVQTAGRSQVRFKLPPDTEMRSAMIDEMPLAETIVGNFGEQFTVDLPAGKQFTTIVLVFATPGELPGLSRSLEPAWPEIDIPVLSRRWKLWLPAGYELAESDDRWESPPIDPPTWSQRLFGPLGRSQRARTFDPVSVESWYDFAGRSTEDLAAQASGQRFRSALSGALAAADGRHIRLSWKELFTQVSASLVATEIAAFADLPGLDQIALNPDAPVPQIDEATGDRGTAVLRQAKLFVLCGPRVVVLTSEPALSEYRLQVEPSPQKFYGRLLSGPLALALESDAGGADFSRAMPLAQWPQWAAGRRTPWRQSRTAISPSWESRGWNTYTLSWGAAQAQSVRIVRTAAMQSLSWTMFLLVLALGAGKLARRLPVLMLLAALCAALALLVSAAFVPVAAGAFLGSLCCILFSVTDRPSSPPDSRGNWQRAQYATSPSALLVLTAVSAAGLGLIAGAAESPPADSPPPKQGPADPAPAVAPVGNTVANEDPAPADESPVSAVPAEQEIVQRIFVPVDESHVPVGEKIYVPLEFYNRLLRQAAAGSEQPGDWLLTRAAYHATLSPVGAQKNIGVSELKATFDLQVFRPNVVVKLPLGDDGLVLVPDSAKLDGRSIEVVWSEQHRALSFVAEQVGVFRLELGLEPLLQREDGLTGFELAIPPLPTASLSVTAAGEPVAVDVTGARGAGSAVMAGGLADVAGDHEYHADLGPSDRIELRWPDETSMPASLPNLDVEELIWVKLQPGSPVIDARFKFRIVDGRVRRVRVLADPRLRLLPSWNAASGVTGLHILPGDPEAIDLELSGDVGEHVVLDLTFLVAGTSGIGNFRLPRLEAAGARLTNRLLAVTLDPALHWEEQLGDEVRQLAPSDFASAWGESETKPQLVYSIPRGEAAWSLATRPRETHNAIEQLTRLVLSTGTASVDLSASLNTTAGHNFQLRLIGPPGLDVDNVSLLEDGVEQVARWAKDDGGTITAFLIGPLAGRQQFALRGRMRTPNTGEFLFPNFQWPGAELKKNQLQVFRQAQTLVEIEPPAEISVAELAAASKSPPELGRLVASYSLDSPETSVKFRLTPNVPDAQVWEVIFVQRDQELWTATVDCQVTVRSGLVDVLRFEVPPQWTEPYQLDPAARFELVPIPGENRRQLIVYPQRPIADEYHVRIRGRLVPSLGDRLRVPDVVPRGVGKLDRFVGLPAQWESQQVDWEMSGLTAAAAPANWRLTLPGIQQLNFYQVLGEHFQAALKSIDRPTGRPRVRLADIHVAWHADGTYAGVASFDLDPAGSAQAVLSVPPQVELVHLSVAGLPAAASLAGPDSWRLELGSTQLPQRVEAVFRGVLSTKSDPIRRVQVPAPGIEGVDVDRTLWTVYGPSGAGPAVLQDPSSRLTPVRQELARLQATESVLDLASQVAGEQAPEEILRWYAPWKARFVAARNRIQKLERLASRPSVARDQELEALNRQEMSIAERLGSTTGLPDETSPAFESARLFDSASALGQEPARCLFEADAPTLTLRYAPSSGAYFIWRLLIGLAIVTVAVLLSGSLPGDTIGIAPRTMLLLASLFAWLCLMPSALGFVVLLLTVVGIAARRWRSLSATPRPTLST